MQTLQLMLMAWTFIAGSLAIMRAIDDNEPGLYLIAACAAVTFVVTLIQWVTSV